ncbi:MAG: MGMT family protein [Micrococcaceae bacterium]
MDYFTTSLDTPDGPFTIIANPNKILAAGWTDNELDLLESLPHVQVLKKDPLKEFTKAVEDYYSGNFEAVAEIPLSVSSTPFIMEVWHSISQIPPGETLTYRELAEAAGNPRAYRAAATACGKNHIGLFIPCHRVIRGDGSLGGFGRWGLPLKQSLLDREAKD